DPRVAPESVLDREELIERDVLGLEVSGDAAAGEDRAAGVVAIGVGEQLDALDDQDAVLERLPEGRGVVERLQRAVVVGDVERRLGVAVPHRPVFGGDAVRMVDADELEGQLATRRLHEGVLEQAVHRQRREPGTDRAKKRTTIRLDTHRPLRNAKLSLATYTRSVSRMCPPAAPGFSAHAARNSSSAALLSPSLRAAAERNM